ncbi:MBOAT family O-acyltransferase [Coralliovum pocilloporae]|uniref:MBOAT family O-acyltransferase n=1 Tax=Coralliovum pocilloporae TaxID=3066369 RepID=UPI003306EE07
MVFSSFEFIYLFLPPVLGVFLLLRWLGTERGIIWWLIVASLAFYAWWSPVHLVLLISSVVINFALHRVILANRSKMVLGIGISGNLATLAYFKYANFLVDMINPLFGNELPVLSIVLPLAISFFTFQQISFLYDTYKGDIADCDFSKYCLFVVFFPQLIAGPIVLQKDTIPQFRLTVFQNRIFLNLAIGGTLFGIGLFKKLVFADGVAPMVNMVFGLADSGEAVPMEAAWIGALSYTFQIYFDFSGYCDMALGLARMFGIRLPINFYSPYKATSIVDFWRRWHITLSRFLRDYLYIPLGGNKKGPARRYVNLMATMVLGGLWHGAAWTFVFWGFLHGLYLIINHGWNMMTKDMTAMAYVPLQIRRILAQAITMLAVIVAWVFFRAETFNGASTILLSMAGLEGSVDTRVWRDFLAVSASAWVQFAGLGLVVFFMPNSIELMRRYRPITEMAASLGSKFREPGFVWKPTGRWAFASSAMVLTALVQLYMLGDMTEFIYFNF